ncbi:AtpZ/AtpI family protein [Chloroflexi bacterium TSY]|nr:AtpZ/AtpI family protein [Chloroflexi bacterium TSY]
MSEFGDEQGKRAERSHPDQEAHHTTQLELISVVSDKEARKLAARRANNGSVWFGLGMFGMIGWSVAVPTLVCVALGIWIDANWPSRFSWTLMLLLLGMALGCLNAWFWVTRERRQIGRQNNVE